MLFAKLINFWQEDSELKNIIKEFDDMLIIAKEMFAKATKCLITPPKDLQAQSRELIKLDGKINALQQAVRRNIVVHITVKGSRDILPCLILMSLVKDAERLGDYAKNIMEIAERFTDFERLSYFDRLIEMQKDILKWFDETKLAFDRSDVEFAQKVMEKAFKSEKECDRVAWEMINAKDKKDAVALALLFRFFKRISAHLGNICTSVTMPLDKLDYYDES